MKTLIEKEDWAYYIYEENGTLTLEVPIGSPAPGFDVVHILTNDEIEKFKKVGIKDLNERIEDMKLNFKDYKLNSWR